MESTHKTTLDYDIPCVLHFEVDYPKVDLQAIEVGGFVIDASYFNERVLDKFREELVIEIGDRVNCGDFDYAE